MSPVEGVGPKLETVVSNRLRVLRRACGVLSCWGHLWLLCSQQQRRTFFPSFRFPCFPSSLSPPSPPFSHKHSVCSAVLCLVAQPCPPLCDPMDCRPPGSSAHGDSPGKHTGARCHALLQGIFPTQGFDPGLPCCSWFFLLLLFTV